MMHEKLICDCDQKLQVAKNIHLRRVSTVYQEQNTAKAFSGPILLLPSRNQTPLFIPKAAGEKKNFFFSFFFNLELFKQILKVCLC